MNNRVAIVDCEIGNIGSVYNMFKYIGANATIVSEPEKLDDFDTIVLPGVGKWDSGIRALTQSGFKNKILSTVASNQANLLGICLGMQMLLESSEEGQEKGLGLIKGKVKKFDFSQRQSSDSLKIPHMGWNVVSQVEDMGLDTHERDEVRFYFVHSFHASDVPPDHVLMTCHYGYEFPCAIKSNNVTGVQFHPEKSHVFGINFFKYYLEQVAC